MGATDAVERFLGTGEYDPRFPDWEGDAVARRSAGAAALRDVLVRVVRWRAERAPLRSPAVPRDAEARVRARIAPLLHGLFDAPLADRLVDRLPNRVVLLNPATFAARVPSLPLRTAWDLANLLLDDLGAPPLGDDAPELDGVCVEGHAWVSPRELGTEEPFPDTLVHEAAHLLHTVGPADLSLDGPPGPFLAIPPRRRETFAYACEVWTGALRAGTEGIGARVAAWRRSSEAGDARIERAELDLLLDAAAAHPERGWATLRAWVAEVCARGRGGTSTPPSTTR